MCVLAIRLRLQIRRIKMASQGRDFWDAALRMSLLGPLAGCFWPGHLRELAKAEVLLVPRLLDCFRLNAPETRLMAMSPPPPYEQNIRLEIGRKIAEALVEGQRGSAEGEHGGHVRPVICALVALQWYRPESA